MSLRNYPVMLGSKLKDIRLQLGYTLDEMAEAVGKEGKSRRSRVYEWETGIRVPDYSCLLAYAKLANVSTDDLIDDNIQMQIGKIQHEQGSDL